MSGFTVEFLPDDNFLSYFNRAFNPYRIHRMNQLDEGIRTFVSVDGEIIKVVVDLGLVAPEGFSKLRDVLPRTAWGVLADLYLEALS
jgi:hypothetical protein